MSEEVEVSAPVETTEEVHEAPEQVDHSDRRASLTAALAESRANRDEAGRFAAKEKAEVEQTEQEVKPARKLPSSWRKELDTHYQTLPDEVVQEIERRESDYFKGLEPYKETSQKWQEFEQALTPYQAALQASGKQPMELVNNLLTAHSTLTFGTPEQKARAFQSLAQQYGVSVNGSPQVNPAHNELMTIRQEIESFKKSQEQQQEASTKAMLADFAKDKPHFESVRNEMAGWLQSNPNATLEQAYDAAVWANPATRSQLLQEQQTKAEQERKAKAAEAVRRAKSASASVNGAPMANGNNSVDPTDRRAVMREVLRSIRQ